MGPRSFERGDTHLNSSESCSPVQLQWGRVLSNAEISTGRCQRGPVMRLQWGRVLSNAEIMVDPTGEYNFIKLQWGRVLSNAEIDAETLHDAKEEGLQWGRVLSNAEIQTPTKASDQRKDASMGPRSFERGDTPPSESLPTSPTCFNGAAFFRTRRSAVAPHSVQPGADASMGPRSFERGDPAARSSTRRFPRASMGPRSFERGDSAACDRRTHGRALLQWGRVLSNAEMEGIVTRLFSGTCTSVFERLSARTTAVADPGSQLATSAR